MPIIVPPSGPPLEYFTIFAVDAMFYSAARKARERADVATKGIARAEKKVFRCRWKMDELRQRAEDEGKDLTAYYDKFEPLAISMERLEFGVVEAHGPVLRELAIAQIMSAQSLEAHINVRGEANLTGREWAAFERMPLDAKWLFLPGKLGLSGFDVGAEPFQSFDRLIKIRNQLVHYKPQKEPYHGFEEPDSFAQKLGLTFDDVDRSISAVRQMVLTLSKQLGDTRGPWWLESEGPHFFEVIEKKPKGKQNAQ